MHPRVPRRRLGGSRYRTMSRREEMVTSVRMSGAIVPQRGMPHPDTADAAFASRPCESCDASGQALSRSRESRSKSDREQHSRIMLQEDFATEGGRKN